MDKNTFETECSLKIQQGLKLLQQAILDGTYHHPLSKPAENATPAEREALFLDHFRSEIEKYFRRFTDKEWQSIDNLSYPKSAWLFGIHGKNVSGLSAAIDAAKTLQTHNVSKETILPNGESISGNLGFTINRLNRYGFESFADIGLSSQATLIAALSFDPDRAQYLTHYGTCLQTHLRRSKEDISMFQGNDDFVLTSIPAAVIPVEETTNNKQAVEAIKEIALKGTTLREREALDRSFRLLEDHFQREKTFEELGEIEGVSRQRIRHC
jgi:hypothetical protein